MKIEIKLGIIIVKNKVLGFFVDGKVIIELGGVGDNVLLLKVDGLGILLFYNYIKFGFIYIVDGKFKFVNNVDGELINGVIVFYFRDIILGKIVGIIVDKLNVMFGGLILGKILKLKLDENLILFVLDNILLNIIFVKLLSVVLDKINEYLG